MLILFYSDVLKVLSRKICILLLAIDAISATSVLFFMAASISLFVP